MSKKVDPKTYDYNKDGYPTESDFELGRQDFNRDGKVTDEEKAKYTKQQGSSRTVTTIDEATGKTTSETTGPPPEEEKPKWSRDKAAAGGYTREFLKRHPDIARLLKTAIDNNWTEEEFANAVRRDTRWGQNTTTSQRQFDLEFYGQDSKTIKQKIETDTDRFMLLADNAGVTITEEQARKFAMRFNRSGLSDQDVYSFIAREYGRDISPEGLASGTETGEPAALQGTAAELKDALRSMARSYGVTLTEDSLNKKVEEGLQRGPEWRSWIDGQRNVFRQSAKTMYPSASDKLDEYTLEELVDPYLEDAANLLGIPRVNMDMSNSMWTRALSGAEGKPMGREEWLKTLRTDKQYGWNKTQRAKTEMASLGDELLAAFGMA